MTGKQHSRAIHPLLKPLEEMIQTKRADGISEETIRSHIVSILGTAFGGEVSEQFIKDLADLLMM